MSKGETITISKQEYQQLLEYKSEVELLKHQFAQLQRMLFGRKSERFVLPDPNQGVLFDLPEEKAVEEKTEEITYTRSVPKKEKKHPLRTPLPAHLPRKEEIIEPDNVPENARKIGESITEILEYTPANIYVRKIIRPKYIVDSTDERTQIAIAPMPTLPIPKGNAGASMIAYILISKFVDHLPYSRIAKILKRQNLHTADSTLGGWANKAISDILFLVYEQIQNEIIKTDYLMADETPIPVLTEDKPGATHQGYFWVYYDPVRKMVLFDYQKSRGREGPRHVLKGFKGFIQSDGYAAYNKLGSSIEFLACMAHLRRKFKIALDNDPKRAEKVLALIQKLYEVERQARETELSYDQIKLLRQEKSVTVLEEMEKYLIEENHYVLPKSAIGKAFKYALQLWPRIKRYVDDGRFQIDNNLIENSIRPVALGRRNYLFAGSHNGAKNAARMYSLMATCKLNDIDPYQWLKKALETIPGYPTDQIPDLIPKK